MLNINSIPVFGKFDVVVVGAGPGGIGAATAAARLGKSVLLVEKYACASGVASNSACSYLMGGGVEGRQIVGGIADEFIRKLDKMGQAVFSDGKAIGDNPITSSVVSSVHGIRRASGILLKESRVTTLYYASMISASTENNRINSIVADTIEGLCIIEGDCFIDATADAHLIYRAGGETIKHPLDECMTKTLFFTLSGVRNFDLPSVREKYETLYKQGLAPIKFQDKFMAYSSLNKGTVHINMTMVSAEGLSSSSLTEADYKLREQIDNAYYWLRDNFEEFKESFIIDTSFFVGVRCGRSIKGLSTLTTESVSSPCKTSDPVALGMRRYGGHGLKGFNPKWASSHPGVIGIPWGTLISKSFVNAFGAGRCISADSKVIDSFRFMLRCMAIGEAAGVTAALSYGDYNNTDYEEVKRVLLKNGAVLG